MVPGRGLSLTMTGRSTVTVLLATFNGEDHVKEQIASIRRQQGVDWRLLVRDDGSHDDTVKILRDQALADTRIQILADHHGRVGVVGNFALLAAAALREGAAYVAFADQDDYWSPDKLRLQMDQMIAAEAARPGLPLLVHTDLEVVDAELVPVAPSFMRCQGVRHQAEGALRVLLPQNFVTGCTVLVNRSLLMLALPIPAVALMHDWWLALCAAAAGHIEYIDRPLVKYRQHGGNQVGLQPWRRLLNPFGGHWLRRWRSGRKNFWRSVSQAGALARRLRAHSQVFTSACHHLPVVEGYAGLVGLTPWQRYQWVRRAGVHNQLPGRQVLLLLRLWAPPE